MNPPLRFCLDEADNLRRLLSGRPVCPVSFDSMTLDPDAKVDMDSLAALQEQALRRGLIQAKYDLKELVDPSYVERAARMLAERASDGK